MPLGEEGTEQFELVVEIDGNVVGRQPVHDPFITNRAQICMTWGACFRALFRSQAGRIVTVTTRVHGTPGAVAAVMNLEPEELIEDTREILRDRARKRERQTEPRHFEGRAFE